MSTWKKHDHPAHDSILTKGHAPGELKNEKDEQTPLCMPERPWVNYDQSTKTEQWNVQTGEADQIR